MLVAIVVANSCSSLFHASRSVLSTCVMLCCTSSSAIRSTPLRRIASAWTLRISWLYILFALLPAPLPPLFNPPHLWMLSASSSIVRRGGHTTVHELACPHLGRPGLFDCGCPRRLAAGTVDSYVGMLCAIFNSLGRLDSLNPCNTDNVKGWVRVCALEQQRHRVPVKQARPVFSMRLRLLVRKIKFRLSRLPRASHYFLTVFSCCAIGRFSRPSGFVAIQPVTSVEQL